MQRKVTSLLLMILLAFMVITGISCTNDVKIPEEKQIEKPLDKQEDEKTVIYDMDGGEAQVKVSLQMPWDNGKSLTSNHDNTYSDFLVTTKYLSERRDGSTVTGEFTDLRLMANGDGGRNNVDLGWFTQGRWLFTIQAANSDGDVLYRGSWQGYVSAATTNSIMISMEENADDVGYIALDVASITVPLPRIVVTYSKVWNGDGEHLLLDTAGDGRGLEMTNSRDGYTFYRTPDLILPAGAYALKIQLWSDDEIFSGEVLDTYIVPKKTTPITGVFTITGLANFLRVTADQTIKFTEACDEIEIEAGKLVTGFHRLGLEELVDFPYENTSDEVQYLVPQTEDVSAYFTNDGGLVSGTGYPHRYLGFNYGFADSPREIASGTFAGTASARKDLRGFYSPDTVTIGDNAFAYTNLEDTRFGTLDSIGDSAFRGSTIPELDNSRFINTVSIGNNAFRGSGIKYVDLPSGSKVGTYAFAETVNLYRTSCHTIHIPEGCYSGCTSLAQVVLEGNETIGVGAFSGCSSLKEIIIPDTVTDIFDRAFDGCSSLSGTLNIPESVKTIGNNAFRGTSGLYEIYVNAVCGDITGEPWGAPCDITWWAYKLLLNSNLPADYVKAEGEEEFPMLTEKNGILLKYPIDDPKYRLIAYNDVIGATLDGYPIPIPIIDGYALRGWFTDPAAGEEITQLTVNTHRTNWTVYAHWVRGLITVVFQGGRGGDSNTGVATETYRMVRYQGYYGYMGEEDEKDDHPQTLPTASIAGRDFIGWYLEPEPMLDDISPDETSQSKMYRITDKTQVETKKSHTLFAHYRDHRYTVKFNANLPTNASTYGTRNGVNVYNSYTAPSSYTVIYNQPYSKSWDASKLSSSSYRGTTKPLPDLNSADYFLDNYWFVGWYLEPECINRVWDSTKVSAQVSNGTVINLYAKWIGREKTVSLLSRYKADPEDRSYTEKTVGTFVARFTAPNTSTEAWRTYFNKYVTSSKEIEKDGSYALPTINASTNGTYYVPGYTFNGWYTGFSDGSNAVTGTQVFDGKTFGSAPTEVTLPGAEKLYAKWTANQYTVTFNAMGGSVNTSSKTVTYHSRYGELPVPTRAGFVFTGWYTESERGKGYGYQNSPAYMTANSYVRTVGNHTLYAGWTGVAIIAQASSTVSPLNTSLTYKPTENGGYYGSGTSNVGTQSVAVRTVMDAPTNGVLAGNVWKDNAGVVPLANQTVTVSMTGAVSTASSFTTDSAGNATISVSTTASAVPGTAELTLKTVSSATGGTDGKIYVSLHGKLTGVTLTAVSEDIYLRNTTTMTASLVSSEGNLHASNCGINWTFTAPDSYTKIDNGATAVSPGGSITTSGVTSNITLRAGYELGTATITAQNPITGVTASKGIALSAVPNTIEVKAGDYASAFFTNVEAIYSKSDTAKKQWLITGFRQWEGGDPYSASSSSSGSVNPGERNNTGHKIYLFPIVPAVYPNANSTVGALNSNAYIAFPSNAIYLGTYHDSDPGYGYGDYKGATKIYIAGEGCVIGRRAFSMISNNCEFKIAGWIYYVRSCGFADSSGIWGITTANYKAIQYIEDCGFSNSLNSGYNHSVDLSGCKSLGWGAFINSKITSLTTPLTAERAFQGCTRLSSVTCSDKNVWRAAFARCTALSSLTLKNTVKIWSAGFFDCNSLSSVSFPSTLTELERAYNWYFHTEGQDSNEWWQGDTGGSWAGGVFQGTSIQKADFSGCTNMTSIGGWAFISVTSLTELVLPPKCKTIEYAAFYNTRLKNNFNFPSTVTTIEGEAFEWCSSLTSLWFYGNGINIGYRAFYQCTGISSIGFSSTTAITLGQEAFKSCTSLSTVDFLAMGTNFNNSSFSKAGTGVWADCKLRYIKVARGNFGSSEHVIINRGSDGDRTQYNSSANYYFRDSCVYFYAGCWGGAFWQYNAWARIRYWDNYPGHAVNVSSSADWSREDTVSGLVIHGYAGNANNNLESSCSRIYAYDLNHSKSGTAWSYVVAHGYKFSGQSELYRWSAYDTSYYCNAYVYPGAENLENLMAIT